MRGVLQNIPAVRVPCLLLVVVTAGCEQIFNHYLPVPVGSWILYASIVMLTVVFLLQLLQQDMSGWKRLMVVVGVLLLVGLPILYVSNASHHWRPSVGLLPVPHRSFLPASAYPLAGITSIWLGLGFASVLGTATLLRARQREVVLSGMVAVAFFLAVWVLCQRAIPRRYPIYEWTGWFVSRNHFAAFACLLFPVSMVTGLRVQQRAFAAGKLSSPAILFYLAAAVLGLAIVESGSRAGMGILVLQAIALLIGYSCRLKHIGGRYTWAQGITAVILVVMLMGTAAYRGNWNRIGTDLGFRRQVAADTLAMWRDNLWWGTGPRSYSVVFPYYQSDALQGLYFHYAHNDPVQFLAEWGVLGVVMLLLGVVFLLQGGQNAPRHFRDIPAAFGCCRMECFGLSLALGGLLLHSLVDFPLQHTHILLLSAVWLGFLGRICSFEENAETLKN